jgi:ribulose-5-phosphate 4-epimerase/fuculose-1-phosphate aldolase
MIGLRSEDMVIVDSEGQLIQGEHEPPGEVYIHTEVYRARPDVKAVVHTHQRSSVLLGVLGVPAYPVIHSHVMHVGDVGMWECPLLVSKPERGANLASALGLRGLCHMRGHGIVAVGESVEVAVVRAALLEELADATLRILQTGREPWVIGEEWLAELRSGERGVAGRWAYYKELVAVAQTQA